jgi:hypothetical protein
MTLPGRSDRSHATAVAAQIAAALREVGHPGVGIGDVLHVYDGGPAGTACHCFGELADVIEARLVEAGLR